MKKQYSFRLNDQLIELLDREAIKQNRTRTEILEYCIGLLETNEPHQVQSSSLEDRVKRLELKFESLSSGGSVKPIILDQSTSIEQSEQEFITTRQASWILGYPNSSNLSTYLEKSGYKAVSKIGRWKAFRYEDIVQFGKERNRQIINNIEDIPEDYV